MAIKIKKQKEIIPTEYDEQCALFAWAEMMSSRYKELGLLNASLMGIKISLFQQVKAKRMGCKKGWPDVVLPVARCGYNALYIEMKRKKGGVVSDEQWNMLNDLNVIGGNLGVVTEGFEEARDLIMAYLLRDTEKLNKIIGCDHG